ncbi:ferric-chelate reductase 1-like isoform X1 [Mizuhopecten yessoensis]|uniref:ferric-chelate reductase 1-like isoform X1 n=1 Tax=Mizuhopecten yessoensis TaxID=6573 RepID=UPI000B457E7C|nr:ferric-chelate reductase 1-like isoform X1 [Mizuhopecten yessoensis]
MTRYLYTSIYGCKYNFQQNETKILIIEMLTVIAVLSSVLACHAQTGISADPACDVTKGCFSDCSGSLCSFLVTWRPVNNGQIVFEITSAVSAPNSWAAIGFSGDRSMGSDSVVACVSSGGVIAAESGYTDGRSYRSLSNKDLGLSAVTGTVVDSVMSCSFTRTMNIPGQQEFYDLQQDWHILFARGQAVSGNPTKHAQSPIISREAVDFQSTSTLTGTEVSYPLVKAHGSLMIVAWVLLASIGIFVARYMKPLWPNSTLLGAKVWFPIHRICMGTAMTLTIIAFIIIFVEAGGYAHNIGVSAGSILFGQYHPVLGIIVTILSVVNPTMAIFRCAPDHEKRPIFNFAHRICGISAHIIAAITIIFGTYLEKSQATGSASGVAIAYLWVFMIVNIVLEVYMLTKRREAGRSADIELVNQGGRESLTPEGLQQTEEFAVKCAFGVQILLMSVFALTLLVLINSG